MIKGSNADGDHYEFTTPTDAVELARSCEAFDETPVPLVRLGPHGYHTDITPKAAPIKWGGILFAAAVVIVITASLVSFWL